MKGVIMLFYVLLGLQARSQNVLPFKQSEPSRVSGDTIFVFAGERLFFGAKSRRNKLKRIKEVEPTTDSSKVLIFNFDVLKFNPTMATLSNPFKETLRFKIDVRHEHENSFIRSGSLIVLPKGYAPMAWPKPVKCIKVYDLHFM